MNLDIYQGVIRVKTKSVFGDREETFPLDHEELVSLPVVKAWLDDDELQEMTVCSSNIGFVKTYRKFYRQDI